MNVNLTHQPTLITVQEFCKKYAVGRTKAYELFNAREVEAKKIGSRTLVVRVSAEKWFADLPYYCH